ncbi:DEAD/DEAH box helicase family protein [Candidatus Woesebacteria bacterium]|nr:DEAD/DEAH box helicase family protein [Candidatus Woesebacteria bacterium]
MEIIQSFNQEPQPGERALYEPQKQVVADIATALLHSRGPNGYIDLPTGAGKTVVASTLLESIHRDGIVAVPTKEIQKQFRAELERMGARAYSNRALNANRSIRAKETSVAADQGVTRQTDLEGATPISATPLSPEFAQDDADKSFMLELPSGKRVLITTHSSLRTDSMAPIAKMIDHDSPRMLIVDEGHMAIGTKTRESLAPFLENPQWMVLAMSATPEYSEESVGVVDHSLAEHIGPCLHRITIQEAVDAGLIAPFRMSELEVGLNPNTPISGMRGKEVDPDVLSQLNKEYLNSAVVALLENQLLSGKKVVIQCNSIAIAQEIQEQIKAKHPQRQAFHINGKMSPGDRDHICQEFNSSDQGVLVGAEIVKVGLDLSDVGAAIVVGNTESKVRIMQAFGRALRIIPGRESEMKELIHVRNPSDANDTLQYMTELRNAGHIPALAPEYDQVTGEMIYKNTNIAQVMVDVDSRQHSAIVNTRGEVLPSAQWRPKEVPPEFVSWVSVLGESKKTEQETQLTILAVALSENEDLKDSVIIAKQKIYRSDNAEWGIWLDPQAVNAYHTVRKRMEAYGINEGYVPAVEIARRLQFDWRVIANFIRDNPELPEIQQAVLGLVERTKGGGHHHFGFVTEMYPVAILQNPKLPSRLSGSELQNPDWVSIPQLENGEFDGIPPDDISRVVFTNFVEKYLEQHPEEQSLRRLSSVINSRDLPEYQYHIELVRKYKEFMDEEQKLRTQNYTSVRQLKLEMGIFEYEVREYIDSLTQVGEEDTMPPVRRFAIRGHQPYGDHIRNDLVVELVNGIVEKRKVVNNPKYLKKIVVFLLESDMTEAIDEEVLASVLDEFSSPADKKRRKTERDRRVRQMKIDNVVGNIPSPVRELVDAIVEEYKNRKETPPNHTPIEM